MDEDMFENNMENEIDNSFVIDYSEEPNGRRIGRNRKNLNNIWKIGIIVTIVILFLGGIIAFSIYNNNLSPVSKKGEGKDIKLLVEKGDTVKEIAKLLKEKGAIKDENTFNIYTRINRKTSFKQGRYKFSTEDNVKTIVDKLVNGDINKEEIKLQLLEGKTIKDLAEVVEKNTVNTKEQFLNKMKDKEYIRKLSEKYWFIDYNTVTNQDIYYPLEGYLFPDTYIFDNKEVGIETIIDAMLKQTEKRLEEYKNISGNKILTVHRSINTCICCRIRSRNI